MAAARGCRPLSEPHDGPCGGHGPAHLGFDSRALPTAAGTRNVVVTRNAAWHADGAERASSLEEALALLAEAERVFVIGGAQIYAAALPLADELALTEIELTVAGDTVFPPFDPAEFPEVTRDPHVAADGTPFAFVTYARRP